MYRFLVFCLLCISVPLQILIGIFVLFCSGLPIIFKQKRIGKNGTPFVLYKFRTMESGSEKKQQELQKQNEADGPVFKIHDDPRFTAIGKFLSHTGLDEVPQLWNVFWGDMALIGPRPLPVQEADQLTPFQKQREQVKPGILSPWILEGYHNKPFAAWMKSDVLYATKKSFLYDLQLFLHTIPFVGTLFLRELFRKHE